MKILVLNCGSSSIKYKLYNMDDESVLAQGGVERIGLDEAFLKLTLPNGEKKTLMHDMPDHKEGVNFVFQTLLNEEYGAIKSLDEIDAVGHRIVQGGDLFEKSCLVDQKVEDGIESLCDLAPVHNAGHLKGIRAVDHLMPTVPQVTVFDNAFHSTMPDYAFLYAVPYELYEKYHVRRYGFHGTSHDYVSARTAEILGKKREDLKIVVCHLGNGASISAVKNGKCVDTSMGLTPLEGLIMGTRSGDLDPAILSYIGEKENLSAAEVNNVLNKKSGVFGLSGGVSSDFRDLNAAANEGNDKARLALDTYYYRVAKYIAGYAVALQGIDVISFTAGVGENDFGVRENVCKLLAFMGVKIDDEKNKIRGEEITISTPDSAITVMVVPTNEELAIARQTIALL